MTTPTADAIRLAVKLSGHSHCQHVVALHYTPGALRDLGDIPCPGCLGDAATIDRELLLPEKHRALMAAQAVADLCSGEDYYAVVEELREALSRIKTPAMPHLQPTTTPLAPWPPKTQ